MKKVCVIGLGFVGSAMSVAVSRPLQDNKPQFQVVGIDKDTPEGKKRIESLNRGIFPFPTKDNFLKETLKLSIKNKNFFATSDFQEIQDADIIIVDINLDVKKFKTKYEVIIQPFEQCIEEISQNCKEDSLIIIETTVPPGTTQKIALPIIKRNFKKRGFKSEPLLSHSYERVMPGPNYLNSIINFPRVFSAISIESKNRAKAFFNLILNGELSFISNTNASEMAKVLENSYRAMNIAFIEEWTVFAEKAGVDLYEVLDRIRSRPTHANIMSPGLGVGGYCLTKDSLLAEWASKELFKGNPLFFSNSSVNVNDNMASNSFSRIKPLIDRAGKKVLLLGASYLADIGDDRSSPAISLYDSLKKNGNEVDIIDEYITFISSHDLRISNKPRLSKYDTVILTTSHSKYLSRSFTNKILNLNPKLIIDCWGKLNIPNLGNSIKFVQLGNGATF